MRIGIDCRLWNESGIGRYIRNLIEGLEKIDDTNSYFLFALSKDKKHIEEALKKKNFFVVEANFRWHSFEEQLFFPVVLYKSNLDLVHFPYFSVPLFYQKPFVITIHDMITWQFATGKASTLTPFFYWVKQLVYRFVVSFSAISAKQIIAVSNTTKEEIIRYLHVPESKILVTYEGISNLSTSSQKHTVLQNLPTKKFFLSVGNGYPHKNLEVLITAFSNIERNDMSLVIVGGENYFLKKLQVLVKKRQIKNIFFTGFVPDETLSLFYQKAYATIIPSLMEGFGLPPLEAMSQKSLVAVSDIPIFHEICKESVIYFNPSSIEDIKRTLEKILSMGKKEQDHYKKLGFTHSRAFSWESLVRKTKDIYESSTRL